jgi:prolyl 4-hydroxylase
MGPGVADEGADAPGAGAYAQAVPAVPAPLRAGPDGRTQGLPAPWQDWLTAALVRGEEDDALLSRMCASGFDATYAQVTLAVLRSMTERVRAQNPAALTEAVPDAIRLPVSATRMRAADREVRFAMVLANPNVALIENLLSEQECDKLIRLGEGKVRRSEVVDPGSGRLEISGVRSSEGTHFDYGENAIVARVEARVAALTGIPVPHGEPLQLLHYPVGGEYVPHHDFFDPQHEGTARHLQRGGQRVATVVIYLREADLGGDTYFPELELSVRPARGSALYFEYCNAQGELDARCLHAGRPVLRGHKWIATKWLRERAYGPA